MKNSKEMTKAEIEKLVKSEVKKMFSDMVDDEVNKVIKKPGTKSRNELISTIKDSMEAVYKVLWQKRDFWKSDIK
jgi:hypothetical protein